MEINIAEKLMVRGKRYWQAKGYNLAPKAQELITLIIEENIASELFKRKLEKMPPFVAKKNLIKSSRYLVGSIIKRTQ